MDRTVAGLIFGASACVTLSVVLIIQYLHYQQDQLRQESKKKSRQHLSPQPKDLKDHVAPQTKAAFDAIAQEQLARNIAFLGEERVEQIKKSFVIVVGLGGVGSHAATMLVRNGVGKIRLIDFDQVTVSSLNRHANATREDVGLPKTQVLKNHLLRVCPHCEIDTREVLFNENNAATLLEGNPDYVLDCIDNIDTKIALLRYCKDNNLKVICSMGAGAKSDPSKILVGDISDTSADPLSRVVRRGLKKFGIDSGIPTVFSLEIPKVNLVPLGDEQAKEAHEFQVIPDFRVRILPVLGPLPAMFGNAMSIFVLQSLCGYDVPPSVTKNQTEYAKKLYQQYQMKEKDRYKTDPKLIPFDVTDVMFLLEEVWRYRSPLSGQVNHLTLVRWDKNKPPALDNVILLTLTESQKHFEMASLEEYPAPFRKLVEAKFEEQRQLEVWRR